MKSVYAMVLAGLVLGAFSVILGIGGGPLNILVLSLFFSMSAKESVKYSLIIILFSQLTKLISLSSENTQFSQQVLLIVLFLAVLGGYLGTIINHAMSDSQIRRLYTSVIIFLSFIALYNTLA